jgi:N-acetylglucosamine transport system permease protein
MKNKSRTLFILISIVPGLLLTAAFMIIPTIKAFYSSFFEVSGMTDEAKFIGMANFKYILTDDNFIAALKNTFALILVVPICTLIFSLIFAVLLTQSKLKEKSFYRIVIFLPSVLSLTVVAILWSFIYHPTMGVINSILEIVGQTGLQRPWLGDSKTALWAIAATMVWQAAGYYMVMYIAGIDGIPPELYESATIDGANAFKKFFSITMPFLWEIVRITIILAIGGVINISFILSALMTNGGPGNASYVLLQYMYLQAFQNSNFGYAMAIAVVILIISFGLSYLSNKLTQKETIEF